MVSVLVPNESFLAFSNCKLPFTNTVQSLVGSYVTCSVKMSDKSPGTVLRYGQLNVDRGFFGQNEICDFLCCLPSKGSISI